MEAKIKVWITRQNAFSIQCGGLERCTVHFSKPSYCFQKLTEQERDTPFGYISDSEGLFRRVGWVEFEKKSLMSSLSVGQWIGYDSDLSYHIWEKLGEHFKNKPIITKKYIFTY